MTAFKWLFSIALVAGVFFSFRTEKTSSGKEEILIEIVTNVLDKWHYSSDEIAIDDAFSENLFNSFLKQIDGGKQFLLKSDLKNLGAYRTRIDDQLKDRNVEFFNVAYQTITQRIEEVELFYNELIDKPYDFSIEDEINLNFDEIDYSNSVSELRRFWRKRLKLNTLERFVSSKELEKQKAEDDPNYVSKTDEELEREARDNTRENMQILFDGYRDLQRRHWFAIYMNTVAQQFDPHTNYFAPPEKERFDMGISGKYEGIGARLQKRNQEVKIVEVILGGPVWRDKLLEVGDVILQVSQKNGEPIDIGGMILDDAVDLIKGPKGTEVTLTVRRVDGTVENVVVVRDQVELEETYAKSLIIESDEKKYGLIQLPKFYTDFNNVGERDAAKDVKDKLVQLKKKGVKGIILDLRSNGGGSLQTAVDMTGFFIEDGPVVQVNSIGGKKEVLEDKDRSIVWDGPLVVLVNELSASASEILAGALQDYQRAIILGSSQTFGKGTVQNLVDLNRVLRGSTYGDKLGALKLTTDMYYRVNGKSTQLEGVKSDIVYIDRYAYLDMGEKNQENPIPWKSINPVPFTPYNSMKNYQYAIKESKQRMNDNQYIQLIDQQASWIKEQQEVDVFSLNYENFLQNRMSDREFAERFEKLSDYRSSNSIQWLSEDNAKGRVVDDEVFKERQENWRKSISSDFYIDEAVEVLKDLNVPFVQESVVAQSDDKQN